MIPIKTVSIDVEIPDGMSEQDAVDLLQTITNITLRFTAAGLNASGYPVPTTTD